MAIKRILSYCIVIGCAMSNVDGSPSVIIIGAGSSGIAAASRLLENNITNIVILEAESRIGGRINTVSYGDGLVELGAEYCHGGNGNTIYDLVKKFDLLKPDDTPNTYYHSSRKYIDQEFAEELNELLEDILYDSDETNKSEATTLGDKTDEYIKTITKLYGNDSHKLKFATEFLSVMKLEVLADEGAFSWYDVAGNTDYKASGEEKNFHWNGHGYKTILDVLMKNYPDLNRKLPITDKVLFNKDVINIIWDDEQKVCVTCLDNSTYTSDHVIVTTSLGVLKDRHRTFFTPALPQEKINAIEDLGIASVTKIFAHFPTKWWSTKDFESVSLMWSETDKSRLLEEFPDGPNKNGRSWLLDVQGFYPVPKNPNVVIVWFLGELVPETELCSDDTIIDGFMYILNKFLGHLYQNITRPDSIRRFNWYHNPHFRGAYSYQTVKSRKTEVSAEMILSQPLVSKNGKDSVFFAGEATSPNHYATVHGAIETGFREADRIVNYYK